MTTTNNYTTSRDRPVRAARAVRLNSPRTHARQVAQFEPPALAPSGVAIATTAAAHRGAHRSATSLVPAGIGGCSLVAVSSVQGTRQRRGGASWSTSNADVDPRVGPPFATKGTPAISRKMCGVFLNLGIGGAL